MIYKKPLFICLFIFTAPIFYFFTLYIDLYPLKLAFEPLKKQIPIIVYHGIEKQTKIEHNLSVKDFVQQMEFLKKNKFNPITIREYIKILNGSIQIPQNPVILTFHDSHRGHYDYVFKYLKRYEFKASFFIVANWTRDNGRNWTLSWKEIREINNYKNHEGIDLFDIEAHSLDHYNFTRTNNETIQKFKDRVEKDIASTRSIIKDNIGEPPEVFSLPSGTRGYGWKDSQEYQIITKLLKKHNYNGLQTGRYFTQNPWSLSGISIHNISTKELEFNFILNHGKNSNYFSDFLKWLITIIDRLIYKVLFLLMN